MIRGGRKGGVIRGEAGRRAGGKMGFKVSHLDVPCDPLTGLSKLPPVKHTVAAKVGVGVIREGRGIQSVTSRCAS